MNSRLLVLSLAVSAIGLAGCNELKVEDYVTQTVTARSAAPGQYQGDLEYRQTTYFTNYRQQCDTEICGYDQQQVCHPYTDCGSRVYAATAMMDHDGDHDHHDHDGGDHDGDHHFGGGGGGDHDDHHFGGGGDHDGDDHHGGGGGYYNPGPVCYTRQVCDWQTVPRYCQVNCREVPFQDSRTNSIESPVVIRLVGADSSRIESVQLGVKTNGKFQSALANPGSLPKAARGVFNGLSSSDRTVLVMKAKGMKLVPTTQWLNLPFDYKPGNQVVIQVRAEDTGTPKDEIYSAIGTTVDFPALDFTLNQ